MSTAFEDRPAMNTKRPQWIARFLLVLAIFNLISCGAGAVGLMAAGPDLFGFDILSGTAFEDQYWLAAVALGFVGVVQLLAVVAHLKRSPWSGAAHAIAGMTMMVFLFVEVLIVDVYFFLQPMFFALGALQLSVSPLMRGLVPTRSAET